MTRGGGIALALAMVCPAAAGSDDRPDAAAPATMTATSAGPEIHRMSALFKARCVPCHGPAKREGGLSLATPNGIARGGDSGEAIVPGHPEESLLWERVDADEMPPKEPLAAEEKARLLGWIRAGAPGLPAAVPETPEGADHWAFAPAVRPRVPDVRDARRVRTPIDAFIQAALEAKGLSIGPEADRATLIRRVSFDLTGLPPTIEELTRFQDDPAPDAYERMIDRYLQSPRHGERWGKLWLDAVGYADSNGYFSADSDRPLAYRYRDYVVRAWNRDEPLDRFVQQQIAGDELIRFRPGVPVTPEVVEHLAATHFLRNAPDGSGESDGNPDEVRADRYAVLEGTVQVIGSSLLGLTLQCARCHDHKFEPVTQEDYYRLYAILWPSYDLEHWLKPAQRVVNAPLPEEWAAWEAHVAAIDAQAAAAAQRFAFGKPFADDSGENAKRLDETLQAIRRRRGNPPGRIAWLADVSGTPSPTHLLNRGIYTDPGPEVAPGPPSVLVDPENAFDPRPEPDAWTGRRLALAKWLTHPGSRPAALLARVTANRFWQYHFGTGMAATPENLGYSGSPPTHPELLEWLACELAEGGWRVRRWQRLVLTSAVYRQASAPRAEGVAVDPENHGLWRFPARRLDAEAIRDAMLAAAGELDATMGGPYVPTKTRGDGEVVVEESAPGAHRRSIYLQQRRTQVPTLLEVFDAPSIVTTCTRRAATTMPLQSLSLLNSGFVAARGRALAARTRRQAGDDDQRRLQFVFLNAIGRAPDPPESAAAVEFLRAQPARYPDAPDAAERAWIDLCQMVLASNAFLYRD